jgi:hypothetical protein
MPYPLDWMPCGQPMVLAIDTGDPSVGIFGSYLEEVDGECPHVGAVNMCIATSEDCAAQEATDWSEKLQAQERMVMRAMWEELSVELDRENQPSAEELAMLAMYEGSPAGGWFDEAGNPVNVGESAGRCLDCGGPLGDYDQCLNNCERS